MPAPEFIDRLFRGSGPDRSDYNFDAVAEAKSEGYLLDVGSEVSDPVEFVEDDPPDLAAESPLKHTESLPEPTRVIVVGTNDPDYARSSWHGYSITATSQVPIRLVAANLSRNSMSVRNLDSSKSIYLGISAEEAKADGYQLPFGQEHTFYHTAEIWGVVKTSTPTDTVACAMAGEYVWQID